MTHHLNQTFSCRQPRLLQGFSKESITFIVSPPLLPHGICSLLYWNPEQNAMVVTHVGKSGMS